MTSSSVTSTGKAYLAPVFDYAKQCLLCKNFPKALFVEKKRAVKLCSSCIDTYRG